MDYGSVADYPIANEAIDGHPDNRLPPPVSPEELLRLQAQAAESVRLQEALDAALLDVQRLVTERDVVTNRQDDVARSLQETQVSLQTQTQENANLVQLQEELNQRLQALTTERDAALYRNDDDSRLLSETRELLQAEIQLKEEMTQQLDIATSRELKVTQERDLAIVCENSLEAQLGPLREQINELQGLVDGIPILQQSLECARLQVEQLPSLQEKANQSVNQIKSLELKLSNQEQEKKKLLRDLDAKRRRDVDIAKNASKLEAEKQIQAALNKEYQEFGGQVLKCLQNLSLSSDELKEEFSQACAEKYAEGCYLVDLLKFLFCEQKLFTYNFFRIVF
jgi:hypothetical protein